MAVLLKTVITTIKGFFIVKKFGFRSNQYLFSNPDLRPNLPFGGSPTSTGESPYPPIMKPSSNKNPIERFSSHA